MLLKAGGRRCTIRRKTPASTRRRLAAVLFSDIVGYTALMAESEARGLHVRERHRGLLQPLAARYHGKIVDETGDELLLVFPSDLDAVNCALAAQAALRDDPELWSGCISGAFREDRFLGAFEDVLVVNKIPHLPPSKLSHLAGHDEREAGRFGEIGSQALEEGVARRGVGDVGADAV